MSDLKKTIKINLNDIEESANFNDSSIGNQEEKLNPETGLPMKVSGKFHLPVLHLNDDDFWKPAPLNKRRHWTDEKAEETCLSNCCGVSGLKAGCCHVDPETPQHMLGPISEEDVKLIVKTLNKKGLRVSRNDIVMDIEEGRLVGAKFFEGNDIFKDPTAYPMLRMVASGNVFACKFLSANSGKCSIYEFRPQMCRDYYCQYVLTNFLLRTKQKQNTYLKIR